MPGGTVTRRPAAARRAPESAGPVPRGAERGPNAPCLRSLARHHAAAAVEALAAVMRDPAATPAARVSAAGALLAWGYGKASQADDPGKTRKAAEQVIRLVWGGDDA